MVRSALACPHTVVSIILLKVMRFLGYSSNCVRVLEDGVSEVFETASVSSDRTLVHDMEDPSSMALNSVVRICAITFWGLIKLGVYQLCLLAMVFLVDILMFPKSPLIGGEMNVQIRFRILYNLLQCYPHPGCHLQLNRESKRARLGCRLHRRDNMSSHLPFWPC